MKFMRTILALSLGAFALAVPMAQPRGDAGLARDGLTSVLGITIGDLVTGLGIPIEDLAANLGTTVKELTDNLGLTLGDVLGKQ
ncbi:hypothetical protein EDB83DRAFT_2523273 [Lactarius deliciosus]|nr:hypothetical protein EDB83DRAFT_2523273 [Lactarius deliciosus]